MLGLQPWLKHVVCKWKRNKLALCCTSDTYVLHVFTYNFWVAQPPCSSAAKGCCHLIELAHGVSALCIFMIMN